MLDALNSPLGVVTAIVGQSRSPVTFAGAANHAGHDADGVATRCARGRGRVDRASGARAQRWWPDWSRRLAAWKCLPGAANVIPGVAGRRSTFGMRTTASVQSAVATFIEAAREIAVAAGLAVYCEPQLDQPAVPWTSVAARLEARVACGGIPGAHH